jgi:hypothetical protein
LRRVASRPTAIPEDGRAGIVAALALINSLDVSEQVLYARTIGGGGLMEVPMRPTPAGELRTQRVRAICLAIPGVVEKVSHGEAAWFAGGQRAFATMADHHHDDRVAVWCAAPAGVQEALVASSPERFFRPPYYGVRGWIGVWLDLPNVDWDEVARLLADAHATVIGR